MKPPPTTRCLPTLMILIAALVLVTSGAECSSEQVEQYRAANRELKAALSATQAQLAESDALLAQLDEQIANTPEGPEKQAAVEARDQVAGLVKRATVSVAQLSAAVEQSDAAISAALAGNTAEAVTIGGRYAASKLPPPYGVYVLAGTTALGGVLSYLQKRRADEAKVQVAKANGRAKLLDDVLQSSRELLDKTREAAASVITAIEYEKGNNGTVDFQDDATQASLRSRMSTEARKLVEDVRQAQPARLKSVKTSTA